MFTRRDFCIGGVGLLSMATAPSGLALSSTSEPAPLKALAAEKGVVVGTAYSGLGDARDRALIARHADIVVPEWCLKPLFLKPVEHRPANFTQTDGIVAFAKRQGLQVHGHTLYWYADRFDWADHPEFRIASAKYGRFVDEVVSRYPDIVSWDVVNEITANGEAGLLRADYLMSRHGIDFVEFLFKRTHARAPKAVLVLNDNHFQCSNHRCQERQKRALRLVDELLARDVPLHAFGIQSHLSSRDGLALPGLLEFIDRLAQRGLEIYLSELDVNDVDFADDPVDRDVQVADMYHRYLTAVLGHKAVTRMAFWGLSDRDHWLVRTRAHPGRPVNEGRPAPFDVRLDPKPAYHAIADALATAPDRRS